MMKLPLNIGLTGGIGSGKTSVAAIFASLGIPCYIADDRAKELMVKDGKIRKKLTNHFGNALYQNNQLNKRWLADRIFGNEDDRLFVNSVVHPAVEKDFQRWRAMQKAPYILREAAILFETGGYSKSDANILVTASEEVRLSRVMKRDGASKEQVLTRMRAQWPDSRKAELADYIIVNDGKKPVIPQVLTTHEDILGKANTGN